MIPSTACVPYFAQGAGSEHFQKNGHSPPCPHECVAGTGLHWSDSLFKPVNVGADWGEYEGGTKSDFDYMKSVMFERGPLSMGMPATYLSSYQSGVWSAGCGTRPNHAVTAIGFAKNY